MKNIIATLFLGLSMSSNAQEPELPPVKIICIGDSITQGGNKHLKGEYTYRLPLYRMLKQKGFNVDFIGTRKHGLDSEIRWPDDFDADHEGYYGATTDEVRQALESNLVKLAPPDIALIHLGSNDQGTDIDTTVVGPMSDIIRQLRKRNPEVKIFLMQIPGMIGNFGMHYKIWRMAWRLDQPQSPVATIPLYWGWDFEDDTFDGAHPNPAGQQKIANKIFPYIEPFLN